MFDRVVNTPLKLTVLKRQTAEWNTCQCTGRLVFSRFSDFRGNVSPPVHRLKKSDYTSL